MKWIGLAWLLALVVRVAAASDDRARAPADRAGNLATYRDPALPLDPRVIDAVATFVKSVKSRH